MFSLNQAGNIKHGNTRRNPLFIRSYVLTKLPSSPGSLYQCRVAIPYSSGLMFSHINKVLAEEGMVGRNPLFIRSYVLTGRAFLFPSAPRRNQSQSLIHQVLCSHCARSRDGNPQIICRNPLFIRSYVLTHKCTLHLKEKVMVAIPYSSGLMFSLNKRSDIFTKYNKVAIPYSSGLMFSHYQGSSKREFQEKSRNPLFIRSYVLTLTPFFGLFGFWNPSQSLIHQVLCSHWTIPQDSILLQRSRNPLFIRSYVLTEADAKQNLPY